MRLNYSEIIAKELSLLPSHVQSVIDLLDEGKTVPFIARYRKEKTGSMDDQSIRKLADRYPGLLWLLPLYPETEAFPDADANVHVMKWEVEHLV